MSEETPTGYVLRKGHDCDPPDGQGTGAVWRCSCGRYWQRLNHRGWWKMSVLDRIIFRVLHR
jgi:hypothetical protein